MGQVQGQPLAAFVQEKSYRRVHVRFGTCVPAHASRTSPQCARHPIAHGESLARAESALWPRPARVPHAEAPQVRYRIAVGVGLRARETAEMTLPPTSFTPPAPPNQTPPRDKTKQPQKLAFWFCYLCWGAGGGGAIPVTCEVSPHSGVYPQLLAARRRPEVRPVAALWSCSIACGPRPPPGTAVPESVCSL